MLTFQYLRYRYEFSELALVLPEIPPDLTRNAVRVGIMTALPVWRR